MSSSTSACAKTWKLNNQKSRQLVKFMLSVATDANRFRNTFPRHMIFEPQWTCPYVNRVGEDFGDGGKFVCGTEAYFRDKAGGCLAYSIGSSGAFSFEIDVLRRFGRQCELHTFDPTGDSKAWTEKGMKVSRQFHAWGLSHIDASNRHNPLMTSSSGLWLGHSGRTIDILKIDCEGCEFAAFQPVWRDIIAGKYKISQIQIEVHKNEHEADVPLFFADAAKAGFELFHKERNHWGCLGWTCVEFSFISKDAKRDIYAHDICPEILRG